MNGQKRRQPDPLPLFAICLLLTFALPAWAVTELRLGDEAERIDLPDLGGERVDTKALRDKPVVLIFGELYHDKTIDACTQIDRALAQGPLAESGAAALLIVSQDKPAADLKAAVDKAGLKARVLHDRGRKAFEAYRVAVLPSVVVIDGQGRIVHALAGLTPQFGDALADALLLASGQIDAEQFRRRLHPDAAAGLTPQQAQARRLTALAGQLAQRGLIEMAEEKYAEAMRLDAHYAPALLGMGTLELNRRRWADAERRFRAVLEQDAGSVEAALGLAYVQAQRGGDELSSAERLVRGVLAGHPSQARAHYLLGLIFEKRAQPADAAASFKKAAELLLARSEREHTP